MVGKDRWEESSSQVHNLESPLPVFLNEVGGQVVCWKWSGDWVELKIFES